MPKFVAIHLHVVPRVFRRSKIVRLHLPPFKQSFPLRFADLSCRDFVDSKPTLGLVLRFGLDLFGITLEEMVAAVDVSDTLRQSKLLICCTSLSTVSTLGLDVMRSGIFRLDRVDRVMRFSG